VAGSAPIEIVCPFILSGSRRVYIGLSVPNYLGQKSVGHVRLCSLGFTSILRAARARLYPFFNLNSMESPIGPNPERGYFAPLEELIDSRRMNLQKLGHFFYR
jgi:hypothetical protein